jgi:glycosyltransferase involved in cell wall biosynthesis
MRNKSLVIIPAFNEEKTIAEVIRDVRSHEFSHIVVIDDGSTDSTAMEAKMAGAIVLSRTINRGMGAATQRGIEYGLNHGFQYFLTIDADKQHSGKDLLSLLSVLDDHDCVIGSRFLGKNKIPFFRRFANKMANVVTGVFFGVWVTDSQSGLRGFTRDVANELHFSSDGFEYATEFLSEVHEMGYSIFEIPIFVCYTPYSLRKGQGVREGMKTLWKLFRKTIEKRDSL